MGDSVHVAAGDRVQLTVEFSDPDEPNADYDVSVFYDDAIRGDMAEVVESAAIVGASGTATFTHTPEAGGYYFAKLTQQSDAEDPADDVWTSPIWVTAVGEEEHQEEDVIPWDEAEDYIGMEVTVRGEIVGSFDSGSILFLNFHQDFWDSLTLVVFAGEAAPFGGFDALVDRLLGNEIEVRGLIPTFEGRLQMTLSSPDQIVSG